MAEGTEDDKPREAKGQILDPDHFPWEDGFTDIKLMVEDKPISVSKGFLMSVSPVFKRMFLSDFKEKNATEIDLPGKIYTEMVDFLRLLLQENHPELTDERIDFLIPLASEYQTKFLLTICEKYLLEKYFSNKLKPSRKQVLKYICLSKQYNFNILGEKATAYISKYRHTNHDPFVYRRRTQSIEEDEYFKQLPTDVILELYRERINECERTLSDPSALKNKEEIMLE